ncbi:MAG: SDR family NAD(P)-dependent oxidoreductase [Euryarchaeota archaeon]|nr:SDR family NAD(P)-dependent oxidoreductase [Euryarchaeota archaeon]MDE2043813.1 SDR family NAD(P)-dependent oxidoreductase [Thermoplasmata archaeon]
MEGSATVAPLGPPREDPPVKQDGVAVVLGAGSPWGGVLAEALARENFLPVLVDAAGEGLGAARERVLRTGASAETVSADLRDLEVVLALGRKLPTGLGTPTLLVHALPPPITGPFHERRFPEVVEEVHRGYSSLVVLARDLLPAMIERREGRIIVLGSAAARAPLAKAAVHSALAAALPAFLTALDREVHRQGVRISYLEPAGYPSPPLPAETATGEGLPNEAHRRFLVSDAAVARAFLSTLRSPSVRHRSFHGHGRAPPSPTVLRRYVERELHGRHPEEPRERWAPVVVSPESLRGRTAVVTGSSRGIGRAIALRLAQHGMKVVLTGRDKGALEKVAKEVHSLGGGAHPWVQDLQERGAAEKLFRFTMEAGGAPYLLVNNAGLGFFRRLVRQDDAQLRTQIEVDLLAVLALSHAFLPAMLEGGSGHLVAVGSLSAEAPFPRLAPYSGIKGAVKGFSLALGREVGHRGLNFSVLEPTTVDTDFIGRAGEPGRRDMRERGSLRRVMIGPDEVGRVAERTLLRPRPVVVVPPRIRPLIWFYRGLLPISDRLLRLPPPSAGGPKGEHGKASTGA